LYKLATITEMLVQPDEWFTQEVIAEGNHIRILLNGKQVVDYVDAKNTYTSGHLALQHHRQNGGRDTVIQFRKIEVVEVGGNSETPSDMAELFNGRDLTGWSGDVGLMSIENGILVNDGKRGTVIAPGDYQNVEIEVDFRLANGGNSGLGICYAGSGDPS